MYLFFLFFLKKLFRFLDSNKNVNITKISIQKRNRKTLTVRGWAVCLDLEDRSTENIFHFFYHIGHVEAKQVEWVEWHVERDCAAVGQMHLHQYGRLDTFLQRTCTNAYIYPPTEWLEPHSLRTTLDQQVLDCLSPFEMMQIDRWFIFKYT